MGEDEESKSEVGEEAVTQRGWRVMKLIDADALMRELMRTINTLQMMDDTEAADKMMRGVHIVGNMIRNALAIDATEVIRCGYCKHMRADGHCYMFADDNIRPSVSDFCSYGERREDGKA